MEEDQGSLATGVGEEGSEGNREGLKSNEHRSWMCHICNKGFSSGKALGGHTRIHNISRKQVHRAKQGLSVAKPKTNNNNTKWVLVSGSPTCSLCGKSFSSMKSLFGHMRSHPERVRKGGIQSITTPTINGASSNSTSSSTLSDDSAAIDLSQALRGWSVTAKRGKSPSCSKSSSGLEDNEEIEPRMQEAVYELMLLASGNPKCKEEELDGDQIEEKPLNKMGCEEGLLNSVFGNSDEIKIKKRNRKKMKLTELEAAEKGNKLVNRCRICNTTFPSHQALESHLCSNENPKNTQVTDETESDHVSATKEEHHAKTTMHGEEAGTTVLGGSAVEAMRGYHCKTVSKTFSNGQVFGDHKRSNWTSMAEAQSSQATSSSPVENGQNCSKILSFDLNQLPPMDVEEGVQSDLFIPANIITSSSSYDSSS